MSALFGPFCTEANCPASRGVSGGWGGGWGWALVNIEQLRLCKKPSLTTIGHAEFRPGQLEATLVALHDHDVFCPLVS